MKKVGITNNNNKGFSLIELSIVLIIIGLLVAGITGGASLIKNAELRSIMTEARGYKMAVNAYYASEDYLPGDDPNTNDRGTTHVDDTDVGDGDGKIEANNGATLSPEGTEAWNDMSDTVVGVLDLAAITLPTVTSGNVPALTSAMLATAKYKGSGWTLDYSTTPLSGGSALGTSIATNALVFTAPTTAETGSTETIPTAILTGIDAYSIDKKTDDGEFTTGSVIGMDGDNSAGTTQTCTETLTTTVCALLFKIDL